MTDGASIAFHTGRARVQGRAQVNCLAHLSEAVGARASSAGHDRGAGQVGYPPMFGRLKKSAFGPISTGPGIYQIRAFGARVTVIASDNGPILVDTGIRGSAPMIDAGLQAANLSFPDIELIVVTHYHPDHSGGLSGASLRSGAKVAAHEIESALLNGEQPRPNPFVRPILSAVLGPLIMPMYGRPVEVDYRLRDGDPLPIHDGVRVVHTPGHTPGCISLLSQEHGWLLVGDALQHRCGRLGGPARYVTPDYPAARASIEKLLQYDFDSIWFSHFPPVRGDGKRRLARLVDSFS